VPLHMTGRVTWPDCPPGFASDREHKSKHGHKKNIKMRFEEAVAIVHGRANWRRLAAASSSFS